MATEKEKQAAWDKARRIPGKDPNMFRRDSQGNQIYKPAYGKDSAQGWEVDHIDPKAKGGSDSLSNLQALQTEANRRKSDK